MALAILVLVVVSLGGQAVRTSYHGYLHSTIGEAVLRQGLLPENPYHAGAPLRYYTLYPTLGVLLGRLGMGPLWGFAVLNLLAALLLGPALDALGRRLQLSFWARRAAFAAMVLGFNGWGYWLMGDGPVPPAGAQPLIILRDFTTLGSIHWDARLQAFLPKLCNVSSFALALPLALAALAQLLGAIHRHASALRYQAALLLGLTMAINPLVGAELALLFLVLIGLLEREPGQAWWAPCRAWSLPALAAVALALPFLLPLFHAQAEGAPAQAASFPLAGDGPALNLLGPLLPLLLLGLAGWWLLTREARLVLGVALLLSAAMAFSHLPWDNQYKFPRVAGLFLALPAGVSLSSFASTLATWRRLWAALACILLAAMVPTTWRTAKVYSEWSDGGLLPLAAVDHGRLALTPEAAARAFPPTVAAAEAALEPTAVLMMHPRHPVATGAGMGASGNRLAPILHHSLYVDLPQIHNQGQPDLRRRLDLVAAVWTGHDWNPRGLGSRDMDPRASLEEIRASLAGRALAILSLDGDAASFALFKAQGATRLASENGVSLWRFAPLSAAAGSEEPDGPHSPR